MGMQDLDLNSIEKAIAKTQENGGGDGGRQARRYTLRDP